MTDEKPINYKLKALMSCREDAGYKIGVRGAIACPKCGKLLSYSVAQNNHVWGRCVTYECLQWAM